MRGKRRHLFVLLFVLGLIAVSALVIASKPTRLGLDLKGGVQLVYQGEPTGQVKTVSGEDIDRSIEIIRERIDKLGVSEPEVSRLGASEISVSLPDVTNAQRAINTVGTTAQLYFYDWEPNLIGPEKEIGGHPGQQPPAAALKKAKAQWKAAGRNVKSAENQQLIFAGAFPTAYEAALLAAKQPPVPNCTTCSAAKPRFYLFERKAPHKLIAGPEDSRKGLYVSSTGKKRPHDGIVVEVPVGTVLVSELPSDSSGKTDQTAEPGWYALKDNPSLSGHRHHRTEAELRRTQPAERHLRLHRQGPGSVPGRHPQDRPARPGAGDRPGQRPAGGRPLRPFRRRPRQRSQDPADHQLRRKPRRDRRADRGGDIRRLQQHPGGAGPGDDPADRRPADRPEADQPDPGLGDARQPGAARGDQGRDHRPLAGRPLPAPLLPLPRPDRERSPSAPTG